MTILVRLGGPASFLLFLILAAMPRLGAQVTEIPQTVAPGKLLMRIDGIRLSFDRADPAGNKYTAVGVASTIVSAGLTSSVDLQVGFDLFLRKTRDLGPTRETHSGIGDLSFRTKWTFWRDDKIGAAAAVIPYVKLPTGSGGVGSDATEGGLIVPWSMGIGGGVKAGAMLQWDVIRNDANNGYDGRWFLSGYLQRDVTQVLGFYGETTFEVASTGLSDWAGSIGVGVLLNITKRVRFDYELLRGLNQHATDWTHILRVNWEW